MAQDSHVQDFQAEHHHAQLPGRQMCASDLNGTNKARAPRQTQDSATADSNSYERRNCTIKAGTMSQDTVIYIHDVDGGPFTFDVLYTVCNFEDSDLSCTALCNKCWILNCRGIKLADARGTTQRYP
jgi:hypothetical protein